MNGRRILALVKVQLKALIREPAYLFLMILFPIMLTLIFGVSFGSMDSGIEGVSLFDTMAPGLLAYACIFMIMTVAQAFSDMREKGLLKRMNTTPLTSGEFMGSHVLSNTMVSVLQVILVIVISVIVGFRPNTDAGGFAVAFVLIIALAVCSVGLGLITATIAKSPGAATGIAFIFIMPQMFFGTFMPLGDATKGIAMFLPSAYVTDAIVMIFNGTPLTNPIIWFKLLTVTIIALVIIIVGVQLFKKYGSK